MIEENKQIKTYESEKNENIKTIAIYTTSNPPETRCYFTAVYSKKLNGIICIGGTNKTCDQYGTVTMWSKEKNKWTYYTFGDEEYDSPFDKKLTGHSCNIFMEGKQEKVFIFGGFNEDSNYTIHSYLLPTNNMEYSQVEFCKNKTGIAEYPTPRSYHSSNYDEENQCIYVYGGTDMNISNSRDSNFQSIWKFSLKGKYWEKMPVINANPQGAPRGHSAVLHKKKLYIFGGVVLFKKFTNNLYTIDVESRLTETVDYSGDIPDPIAFHSADLINDKYFIVQGGLDKSYNAINECYLYNFNSKSFNRITIPLIPKLFGHKVVANEATVYLIGGMDNFKYVGDETLIFKSEKQGENIFNSDEELHFEPMTQIFEMTIVI